MIEDMTKRIDLPDGYGVVEVSEPEFGPNQETMERFEREPLALWHLCNAWLDQLMHPKVMDDDQDFAFSQLTQTIQLWASLHGLGDGTCLGDGLAAACRGERLSDAAGRAQDFIQLIQNRSQLPQPVEQAEPSAAGVPELVDSVRAAKILGISTRTLWSLTNESKSIPCIYVGQQVRYNVGTLKKWIENNEGFERGE
jgi:hypothetical protein